MANRAMAAKVERAKREARETVHLEMTKAPYIESKIREHEWSLPYADYIDGKRVRIIPAGATSKRRKMNRAL